jgi:amino-acid N-acetyltransferase
VNKWYFERCEGMWAIPGSDWVMFWTGKGVVEDEQRFGDYVAVCRNIPASLEPARKKSG